VLSGIAQAVVCASARETLARPAIRPSAKAQTPTRMRFERINIGGNPPCSECTQNRDAGYGLRVANARRTREGDAMRIIIPALVVVALMAGSAHATTLSSPIKVMRCDLQIKGGRAGGYSTATGYLGYTSGYTPGAPYYWNDPLGHAYYQPPTSSSANLFIDFTNVTTKTMKAIDFGAEVRHVLIAEARDVGSFAPNAEIKRKYGVNPLAEPSQKVTLTCIPLKIEYTDGTSWTDPQLPPPSETLYKNHP
jgi:hypothetical protein